ncbi:MAG: hypothetical protein WCK78_17325, partial [Paludibacter sp.]
MKKKLFVIFYSIFFISLTSFTVAQVSVPVLVSPASAATNITSPIAFNWNDVSNATNYRIQVSTSSSGWTASAGFSTGIVLNDNTPTTSNFTWTTTLTPGTTYYWSVKAGTASSSSNYASYRSFTTPATLTIPVLVSPA